MSTETDELYYIQDTRSFHGNALVWWGIDGGGYTSDISIAGKYPYKRMVQIITNRFSDVAYKCSYIDNNEKARKTIIDAQYINQSEKITGENITIPCT